MIGDQHLHSPDGFAHVLFPAIDDLLKETGRRLTDIDCFATTSGPGSSTGLRVGLAAAKGLAEATGKVCSAVSNLRVIASTGTGPSRGVVLDARRGQVFAAVYGDALNVISPEVVTDLRAWVTTVPLPSSFIASEDLHAAIREVRQDSLVEAPPIFLAAALAHCAEIDGAQNGWSDPATVDANYVRRSDAELFWRER
jgi:tRNA threonylcarbamoyladenosine biosynthesis protein TsaB